MNTREMTRTELPQAATLFSLYKALRIAFRHWRILRDSDKAWKEHKAGKSFPINSIEDIRAL